MSPDSTVAFTWLLTPRYQDSDPGPETKQKRKSLKASAFVISKFVAFDIPVHRSPADPEFLSNQGWIMIEFFEVMPDDFNGKGLQCHFLAEKILRLLNRIKTDVIRFNGIPLTHDDSQLNHGFQLPDITRVMILKELPGCLRGKANRLPFVLSTKKTGKIVSQRHDVVTPFAKGHQMDG